MIQTEIKIDFNDLRNEMLRLGREFAQLQRLAKNGENKMDYQRMKDIINNETDEWTVDLNRNNVKLEPICVTEEC